MNFMEAVKALKEGKEIMRDSYRLTLKRTGEYMIVEATKSFEDYYGWISSSLRFEDIEATDWEVVDEDKDWNLANYKMVHGNLDECNEFHINQVKKCRDLILQDISNWDGGDHITMDFVKKRFGDL